jgi:transketolase
MADYEGACYMRTLRADTEFLYSDDHVFNLGGFEVLNEGKDVLLVASGYMVHECNKALDMLDKAGVNAGLVDLYSLPFDQEGLLDVINASGGRIISVEDNFGGGIGSAVADAILDSGDGFRLQQMHVRRIPKGARTPQEMLSTCGIDAASIQKAVMGMLEIA